MSSTSPSPAITWTRAPDVPLPRGGYYAGWHAGGLLLAGGTHWQAGAKRWTDDVSFYDPLASAWTPRAPLPRRLAYGAMAAPGGSAYVLGGCDESMTYRDMYRLHSGRWEPAGQTPSTLLYTAAVAVGRRIFVLGGTPLISDLTRASAEAWAYDTADGRWEQLPPMPGSPRAVHTAAAIGRRIYIFGGCFQPAGGALANLADACCLDTQSGRWSVLAPAPVAARAWGAAAAGEAIYLFGGYAGQFLDSVYRYDPGRDAYDLVGRLPLPLADCKFFFHAGAFYAAAGEDAAGSRFAGTLIGAISSQPSAISDRQAESS